MCREWVGCTVNIIYKSCLLNVAVDSVHHVRHTFMSAFKYMSWRKLFVDKTAVQQILWLCFGRGECLNYLGISFMILWVLYDQTSCLFLLCFHRKE